MDENKTKAKIIAVAGKGGVGKTSLCSAIVRHLVDAHPGKRILAIVEHCGDLNVVRRVQITAVDLGDHRVVFYDNRLNHSFPSFVKHTEIDVPTPFSESICISPPLDASTE